MANFYKEKEANEISNIEIDPSKQINCLESTIVLGLI